MNIAETDLSQTTWALRSDLSVTLTDQGVLLVGEMTEHVLVGEHYRILAPLLEHPRTESELLEATVAQLSPPMLFHMLNELQSLGFLDAERPGNPTERWWRIALGPQPQSQPQPGNRHQPEILSQDPEITAALIAAFVDAGLDLPSQPASMAHPGIVVVEDYLDPQLAAINRSALDTGRSWIPLKMAARRIQVGPWFVPGETACWACLSHRLKLNAQVETFLDEQAAPPLFARIAPRQPSVLTLAARLAALRIAEALRAPARLRGALYSYDWLTHESRWHPVARRPQCPVCGDPDLLRRPGPFRPATSLKVGGSQRSATPEETSRRFGKLVSPLTGVVNWLEPTDSGQHGLAYSIGAGHNFRMGRGDFDWLKRSLDTRTGGKGGTRAEAEASALGEAVERYSSVYRGEEQTRRGSWRDVRDLAPHPSTYLTWSDRQYQSRHAWNAGQGGSKFHVVANPFDESAEVDWATVWSLTHQAPRAMLASYCYFGHPDSESRFFSAGESNGCAAGSTAAEAFVHGFCELVERDAVAIWWYNRAHRPGVDIASFGLPAWPRLQAYYAGLGRSIWALDLSHDLGIPVFAALSARIDGGPSEIIYGFAASLDPVTALASAISELNQFLPAVSRRDDEGQTIYNWPEPEAIAWWKGEALADHPYLLPSGENQTQLADLTCRATDDLARDVDICVERAASVGLEVMALELTRPDIGMPVARVIVPGLRHFWRRLAPGRLYDVPVALGWRDAPLEEDELNPWSIFL